ncbi:hypothetical protein AVEN_150649-1 [Araneus ventricosus]|uniref:Uncharacterized protein n=1 Tax=Araneus ventricosus TaxID=182803 RepID=A0A4Y2WW63_ARAVE|nr:hypothetical protein AVEN_150649-1 [Araneus ventricosus]
MVIGIFLAVKLHWESQAHGGGSDSVGFVDWLVDSKLPTCPAREECEAVAFTISGGIILWNGSDSGVSARTFDEEACCQFTKEIFTVGD